MVDTELSLKKIQRFGYGLVALLFVAIFGWGAQARIAGAIIASGQVAVLSDAKPVQHLEGGIVAQVNVRNGMRVSKDDVLLRLDDTEIKANLEIVTSKLNLRLYEQARLEAERQKIRHLEIPVALVGRAHEPRLRQIHEAQQKLLSTRLDSIEGKRNQLQEQVIQFASQIGGMLAQQAAKQKKANILAEELGGLEKLNRKGLVQKSRLTGLQRESADLEAEIAQLVAETSRLRGKISEIELRIIETDEIWREKVLAELISVRTEVGTLQQQQIAETARMKRIDIRAHQTGVVHELKIQSAGAVLGAGMPVMVIVPDDEELVVRARVAPQDVDQLSVGQKARVVFSAFSQDDVPEVWGEVISVGADLSTDEVTGAGYYRVDISVTAAELEALNGQELRPGMPAEAYIQTGSRTALTYLLKPLSGQIDHAFRD